MCHEFGSDGEAVGEAAFDDGDGLTSALNGGLVAGVFGDVECRGTGCGLSGIFTHNFLFSFFSHSLLTTWDQIYTITFVFSFKCHLQFLQIELFLLHTKSTIVIWSV